MAAAENSLKASQLSVLHVAGGFVFDLGGGGKIVQWLMEDLSKQYRISLAAVDADSSCAPPALSECLERRFVIPSQKWDERARKRFAEQIQEGGYRLIHFHGATFSFDAHVAWRSPLRRVSMAGVPWIFSNHYAPSLTDGLFPPGYPLMAKCLKALLAWCSKGLLLAQCGQEVFDSDENRSQISRWYPWARGKMRTIYHSPLEGAPPEPVFAQEVVTIANIGHIAWRKGQKDLLDAFAQVHGRFPRLRLCLAGPATDAAYAQLLHDEISRRKLNGSVEMPGGLTDTKAFWRAVDVYVQPSHYEGAPMALMEALWLGKPAIGTRISGIPEMIEEGVSGLLVQPRNPEQMAAAIERLVVEADTRRRIGQNAAAHVKAKGMTRREMSRQYAALYEAILAKSRHR
jgi:glycosyltransferase involved in cell wall biosynthesis